MADLPRRDAATRRAPIRVLIADDHPSVRSGLVALLGAEPGLLPIAAAGGVEEAVTLTKRTLPDLVLADYLMGDGDGIRLCRRLKRNRPPPAVVIHTAFNDASLAIAARVAGAEGIVDKSYTTEGLVAVLRSVAEGSMVLPPPAPDAMSAIGARLGDEDLPVLGMLVAGIPAREIAQTINLAPAALDSRIQSILEAIQRPSC